MKDIMYLATKKARWLSVLFEDFAINLYPLIYSDPSEFHD